MEHVFVLGPTLAEGLLQQLNFSAPNERQHCSKIGVRHIGCMRFDDGYGIFYSVLWKHEAPLSTCRLKRTNAQVSLVKPLQQVTQCHRCILGVADARIDARNARYAGYAFDGRCAGDVRTDDGFQASSFETGEVSNFDRNAQCIDRFDRGRVEDGCVCISKFNGFSIAKIGNRRGLHPHLGLTG